MREVQAGGTSRSLGARMIQFSNLTRAVQVH
jgi:hypothetical protein